VGTKLRRQQLLPHSDVHLCLQDVERPSDAAILSVRLEEVTALRSLDRTRLQHTSPSKENSGRSLEMESCVVLCSMTVSDNPKLAEPGSSDAILVYCKHPTFKQTGTRCKVEPYTQ